MGEEVLLGVNPGCHLGEEILLGVGGVAVILGGGDTPRGLGPDGTWGRRYSSVDCVSVILGGGGTFGWSGAINQK